MAKNNAYPREFRERAVELYRSGGVSMDALAKQLGVASTTIANWIRQARIDDGEQPGITTGDRDELTQLRREIRRLEMENEILKRAAAYFAKENVLPI
ncbi:transposase [Microcella frigidaquae]|uniref:Transposase-like protein n=1 Tax=Microcella frigidaquae TaxID=424758 RepID=A0A840XH38_9MICO|nr:transposase [Microcella frigidaquae]MBB5617626.1 transposase-like protein [Microcella frigidaquae]NHN45847.1 transposase [Microcella frigidaquae]